MAATFLVTSLLAACGGPSSATASQPARALPPEATSAFRLTIGQWGTPVSYNPYGSGYVTDAFDWSQLSLAYIQILSGPGSHHSSFYRELATGWKLSKSSITMHLRPSARWQDGKAFTSKDVVDSMLLAGGDHNQEWADISSVTAPNAHTVVFHLAPRSVPLDVLTRVVQTPILPASQYGHLIPKGLERDVVTYWHLYDPLKPTTASVKDANDSPAGKVLTAVSTSLAKFNPPDLLGQGPYKLVRTNTQEILLQKWSGFWDAKSMSIPWLEVLSLASSTQYGAVLSGRVDLDSCCSQYDDTNIAHLDATPQRKYVVIPAPIQQIGLLFHVLDYPFNLTGVRQALAYLINRKKLTSLDVGGKLVQDPPAIRPDGMPDITSEQYLTKAQLADLNTYSYSPRKATSLLEGLGFTKKAGTWYTPKGKPFAFDIYVPSGDSQFEEDSVIMAKDLQSFGIRAASQEADATSFYAQQSAGDYPVSEGWPVSGVFNPLSNFNYAFLSYNYPVTYSGVGSCNCNVTIGIGPDATVPGLGKVNLAAAINDEYSSAPASQWRRYVWDWARYVNQQLPFLPLYNNSFGDAYSAARYTDWPPTSQVGIWTAYGPQMVLAMQAGYLKLRKDG